MEKVRPFLSGLLLICPAFLLVGCATQPQHNLLQPDQNAKVLVGDIHISATELNRVERRAYDTGFADGRAYERLHPSTSQTPLPAPCPVSASCLAQATPVEPPPLLPQTTKTKLKAQSQAKPSPDYSTSGPAQPLSQ